MASKYSVEGNTMKAAIDAWAKRAKEQVVELEQAIREHQADLKLAQERHAVLNAELAIYEAKKATF